MRPLSLQEIIHATSGIVHNLSGDHLEIRAICTDTRAMKPDSLFIAIKGENHDAHDKLGEAFANGALAALVERLPPSPRTRGEGWGEGLTRGAQPLILVQNTRLAMGRLATHIRKKFSGKVIAVAGSNGKTSTKYLIQSVLESRLAGSFSPKSFNNDIGVPLAIFPADPSHDYLILEIGTNHPGEIAALSKMSLPDIAVITSIAAEHLEGLRDIDGVRREEADIIAGLNPTGTLIVNGDDDKILDCVSAFSGRIITFGFNPDNDLVASDIDCAETGTRFRLIEDNRHRDVFVPMLGKHVASNALAALAVARVMNLSDDDIVAALSQAHGPDMRLQLEKINGMTLLNDAYNANPASMKAALETVCALPVSRRGRRIAIVGDMRELGEHTERYHREAGEFAAAQTNLDVLICVGPNARLIAEAARAAGMPATSVRQYDDIASAARSVPGTLKKGDLVLFKASRGVQLETVVKAVQERKPQRGTGFQPVSLSREQQNTG